MPRVLKHRCVRDLSAKVAGLGYVVRVNWENFVIWWRDGFLYHQVEQRNRVHLLGPTWVVIAFANPIQEYHGLSSEEALEQYVSYLEHKLGETSGGVAPG